MTDLKKLLMETHESLEKLAERALIMGSSRGHKLLAKRIKNTANKLKNAIDPSPRDAADSHYLEVVVWNSKSGAVSQLYDMSNDSHKIALEQFFNSLWDDVKPVSILLSILDNSQKHHKISYRSIECKEDVSAARVVALGIFYQFNDGDSPHEIAQSTFNREGRERVDKIRRQIRSQKMGNANFN